MAIYCPNCGIELPDGVSFCDACGTPLRGTQGASGAGWLWEWAPGVGGVSHLCGISYAGRSVLRQLWGLFARSNYIRRVISAGATFCFLSFICAISAFCPYRQRSNFHPASRGTTCSDLSAPSCDSSYAGPHRDNRGP